MVLSAVDTTSVSSAAISEPIAGQHDDPAGHRLGVEFLKAIDFLFCPLLARLVLLSIQMNPKAATRWVVVLTGIGSLMAALDTLVVSTALSTIRARPRRLGRAARVDGQRLQPQLRRAADHRRRARRPLRAAQAVRLGLALFAARLGGVRAGARRRRADRRPRVQGAGAALLVPLGLALLSAAFPPERAARRSASSARSPALAVALGPLVGGAVVQGLGLAVDLLAQRPDRAGRRRSCCTRMAESFGPDTALDMPGLVLVDRRRARPRVGRWCAATRPAGAAPRCSARCSPAPCSSRPSSPGSCARASRCCRWASSARAPSRRATRRSS